jgi:hypothetical protein
LEVIEEVGGNGKQLKKIEEIGGNCEHWEE